MITAEMNRFSGDFKVLREIMGTRVIYNNVVLSLNLNDLLNQSKRIA